MNRFAQAASAPRALHGPSLSPAYIAIAAILIVGLPLHTGVLHVGKALAVNAVLLRLFQPWKELLMALAITGIAIPFFRGEIRFHWRFVVPAVAWAMFLAYLTCAALLGSLDGGALYGLRVYAQPIVAGFAIGVILRLRRRDGLLPYLLACVSIAIAVLAVLQALFPTNAFVTNVRLATADAFGQLPSAMTVSVVSQFRAFATFADPNDLGFFAAIVLLGTLAPVFETERQRRVRAFARAGAVIVLAVSYSRSAVLAVCVGLATHAACALAFDFVAHRERTVRLAMAGMAIIVMTAVGYSVVAESVPQLQHLGNTISGADPSARGHISSLIEGVELSRDRPEGYGLGRVGPRAQLYQRGVGKAVHVESSYLQVGLETGFTGMLIYVVAVLATLASAVAMAGARIGDEQSSFERAWGRALAALIVAQLIGYLFLPTIVSLQTGTLVWAYIGLLSGARFPEPVTAGVPDAGRLEPSPVA